CANRMAGRVRGETPHRAQYKKGAGRGEGKGERKERELAQLVRLRHAARHRVHLHQPFDAVALSLELGELSAGELQAPRHLDGHRVDEGAVDQDLEVTMRPRRKPGRSDEADDLALLHADAGLDASGEAE